MFSLIGKIIVFIIFPIPMLIHILINYLRKHYGDDFNGVDSTETAVEVQRELPKLSPEVQEVLQWYYDLNIQLPYDILEELHYLGITDKAEIFKIIELFRQHWKVENGKKMVKNPYL